MLTIQLDGKDAQLPIEWERIQVLATFDKGSVQPNITTTEWTFANQTAIDIMAFVKKNGLFEGMDAVLKDSNQTQTATIFDGLLDFTDYEEVHTSKVQVAIKDKTGLETLESRASGLTFQFLFSQGIITDSDFLDIPYVVQKPEDRLAQMLLQLAIFNILYTIASEIRNIAFTAATASGIAISGVPGPLGAALYVTLSVVASAIFIAIAIVQLFVLAEKLREFILPQVRFWKLMSISDLLRIGLDHLGYEFSSTIEELPFLHLLPSKEKEGPSTIFFKPKNNDKGYPRNIDFGKTLLEVLEGLMTTFRAKISIDDTTKIVHLEPLINDAFWVQQSTFQIRDVLREARTFNADELISDYVFTFSDDISDQWLSDEYKGTAVEVVTEKKSVKNKKNLLIKDILIDEIGWARGIPKDDLTNIELEISNVFVAMNQLIKTFGKETINNKVKAKLGVLRISQDLIRTPRILYLTPQNGQLKMPKNINQVFTAKPLYDKYIKDRSFVTDNFRNQWTIFTNVRIGFALSDFIKLTKNSYFYDTDGEPAKVDALRWNIGEDFAFIDYRRREPHSTNLKETILVPSLES